MNNGHIFIDKNSDKGVLLLHGFTSTPYQFKELSHYLADKGLTSLAPLIAGHGTKPADLIQTNGDDWLKSAEEGLKILQEKVKKVYVVGNSFGGNLAFELACRYPLAGLISLGTPIFLCHRWWIKLRLLTDCRFRKYYRKLPKLYQADYTDFSDEVTYPVIPIKSLWDFLNFIETRTKHHLKNITAPVLIVHSTMDQITHPSSAQYIHENINSPQKQIYWLKSFRHEITKSKRREEVFEKIWHFIKEN